MSQKLQVRITKYLMCVYWGDGGGYAHMCTRYVVIGGSRGGAAGMPPPPNRIHFFHFRIHFHRKVYASEVGAPPPPTGNPGSATGSS